MLLLDQNRCEVDVHLCGQLVKLAHIYLPIKASDYDSMAYPKVYSAQLLQKMKNTVLFPICTDIL